MMTDSTTEALPESTQSMIGWAIAETLRFMDAHGLKLRSSRVGLEKELNDPALRGNNVSLDFIDVELDTHINLYVDQNWDCREFRDAENGDRMAVETYRVRLNHPTHGSMDVAMAKARFAFWGKVAELAEILSNEIVGKKFERVSMTKGEREKNEATAKENRSDNAYKAAIGEACKGLRLGGKSRYLTRTPDMLPFEGNKTVTVRKGNIVYTYSLHRFGYAGEIWYVEAFLTNKSFSLGYQPLRAFLAFLRENSATVTLTLVD